MGNKVVEFDTGDIPNLATDEPHRWEIEPCPITDFDVLVTNNDDEAREAILEIAEAHLWDSNEPGQERVMKVRMADVPCGLRSTPARAATTPSPLTGEEAKERAQTQASILTKQFINLAEGAIRQTDQMRQGHRSQSEVELLGRVLDEFDVLIESEFHLYGLPETARRITSELMIIGKETTK